MNTRTAFGLAALLAASLLSGTAVAKTVAVPDGTSDWTTLGLASGDLAMISANSTVYVNDLDSLLVVASLGEVRLYGNDASKIVFNVPENETWGVNCYIDGNPGSGDGFLVKKGGGTLRLSAPGAEKGAYNCNFIVEEGVVDASAMYSTSPTATTPYMGVIAVSNGASFYAPGNTAQVAMAWTVNGFAGEGVITNLGPANVEITLGSLTKNYVWDGNTYDFGGEFRGSFTFNTSRFRQFFSGTNSTFTTFELKGDNGNYSAGEGTIGVMKFGEPNSPSTIGTNGNIRWNGGGGFLYLGTGETTSKPIQLNTNGGHPFIDGGAHGGLVFTGNLDGMPSGKTTSQAKSDKTLTLMGSNTTACAMTGLVPNWLDNYNVRWTFHIVKKGPGTWRIDSPTNTMTGTITVEEGTLGFSRLLERGSKSSFGNAIHSAAVSAAITLGSEGKEGAIGLLSPGGETSCSTMRPIVLAGDGRFVNNSTNFLGLGMISVANSSGATLTLDGTNTNSVVYDLADGEGPLSLVKDGAGTWSLAGSNTFTGTLTVRQGTLVLKSGPGSQPAYTWYKFVMKSQLSGSSATMNICQLGLWDSSGARINGSFAQGVSLSVLNPNEAAYGCSVIGQSTDADTFAKLFNGNYAPWKGTLAAAPNASDPSTWAAIVMRVPDGSNPAASWDVGGGDYGNKSNNQFPGSCMIMGSVDGVHYEVIAETNITSYGTAYRPWAATKEGVTGTNSKNHTGGFTIDKTVPSVLDYVMPTNAVVSVASNATLRAEGERYTLSNLKISAAGAGTIDGLDFAETGTLSVVDWTNGVITLPMTFSNCTGLKNLRKWTLTVNGAASNYRICVSGSTVQLIPPGFLVIFQ